MNNPPPQKKRGPVNQPEIYSNSDRQMSKGYKLCMGIRIQQLASTGGGTVDCGIYSG